MGFDGPGVLSNTCLKLKVKSTLSAKVACKCCTYPRFVQVSLFKEQILDLKDILQHSYLDFKK
jgi:hypothetical protein